MAHEAEEQIIMAALPSSDEMRSRFVSALRSWNSHVEIVERKTKHYRLWLTSDIDGPGYTRQNAYGVMTIDAETPHVLKDSAHAERTAARLKADAFDAITEFAKLVAERVSTFRAYNNLRSDHVVTIRASGGHLPRYLSSYGAGAVRVNPVRDEYTVRLGGYFFVCPPGEEHVPAEAP